MKLHFVLLAVLAGMMSLVEANPAVMQETIDYDELYPIKCSYSMSASTWENPLDQCCRQVPTDYLTWEYRDCYTRPCATCS